MPNCLHAEVHVVRTKTIVGFTCLGLRLIGARSELSNIIWGISRLRLHLVESRLRLYAMETRLMLRILEGSWCFHVMKARLILHVVEAWLMVAISEGTSTSTGIGLIEKRVERWGVEQLGWEDMGYR